MLRVRRHVLNAARRLVRLGVGLAEARRDGERWGRITESAVGAHLVRCARDEGLEVGYWRDGNLEVDFVVRRGKKITAVEVKSGRMRARPPGLQAFHDAHRPDRSLLVGVGGIPLGEFLPAPVSSWVA